MIGDVLTFLHALASTGTRDVPPFFIDSSPGDPDPADLMPMRNGLLDLSGEVPVLRPQTPRYFATSLLEYDYGLGAPEPKKWLKLLRDQWDDDPESIDTLHEVLGNLLTPDNRYQKMYLLIGPPRSGRSTIRAVLESLVGRNNVVSTSAAALGERFGLQNLLYKSVAVLGDARASDSRDTAMLMDRILRISGRDPVDVDRKNREILEANLRTRFVIISNEMPNFRDASGAIVTRYLILKINRTIPPEQRNENLSEEIVGEELPGILNLAIAGRNRFRKRGRFVQPESAKDLLEDAEDIASPVKQFVASFCILGPDAEVPAELD